MRESSVIWVLVKIHRYANIDYYLPTSMWQALYLLCLGLQKCSIIAYIDQTNCTLALKDNHLTSLNFSTAKQGDNTFVVPVRPSVWPPEDALMGCKGCKGTSTIAHIKFLSVHQLIANPTVCL